VPKGILIYNLNTEQSEWGLANKAGELYCALWDIQQNIRKIWKYDDTLNDKQYEIVDTIYRDVIKRTGDLLDE